MLPQGHAKQPIDTVHLMAECKSNDFYRLEPLRSPGEIINSWRFVRILMNFMSSGYKKNHHEGAVLNITCIPLRYRYHPSPLYMHPLFSLLPLHIYGLARHQRQRRSDG